MIKKLVSVVIPIYNVEEYLERCLDSIINQTYKNIEIILVNDGSTDNSYEICKKYEKNDSRIKIINKKNGGLSEARNYGIEAACGKYITFVDSDDYVEENYVKCLLECIDKYDADISICSYRAIYDNGTILNQVHDVENYCISPHDALEKVLYQSDFNVSAWAKMYKKELFDNIKFPVGKIFEDAYTTYKLIMKSNKIAVDLKIEYNYMIRSNSILTSKFTEKKLMLIDAYEEMGTAVINVYPDLESAVMRAKIYANLSTLRQIPINYKSEKIRAKENEIKEFVISNRKNVLNNPCSSKRDKIGILTLMIGINFFKFSWKVYTKFTGRNK